LLQSDLIDHSLEYDTKRSTKNYFIRLEQTIVAPATALGGPIAILRVSGKEVKTLLKTLSLESMKPQEARHAPYLNIDKVIFLYFKNPKSFTGEDLLEIHCHGSRSIVEKISQHLKSFPIVEALPGEFSFRAFWNEKMTLSELELLHEALSREDIHSDVASQLLNPKKVIQDQSFHQFLMIKEKIKNLRATLEASIDFPEQVDDASFSHENFNAELNLLLLQLQQLKTAYENFNLKKEKESILLVGEVNAGKSTLFNALCGGNRSIVSSEKGSTRDYVEASLSANSTQYKIIDCAGLRLQGETSSDAELLGIERTRELIRRSDIIIYLQDYRQKPDALSDIFIGKKVISLLTHSPESDAALKRFNLLDSPQEAISFVMQSLSKLERTNNTSLSTSFYMSQRQYSLIVEIEKMTRQAINFHANELYFEMMAEEFRNADLLIERVIGKDMNEEYINSIFSNFCMGK